MRKMLNTLYILSPDLYLAQEGETILVKRGGELVKRLPLLNFESILTQGYQGVSPGLMRKCSEQGIPINIMSQSGRFLSRIVGPINGNVLLRRQHYRIADDPSNSFQYAQMMIIAKVHNQKWVLERVKRDHAAILDGSQLPRACQKMQSMIHSIRQATNDDELRGLEGVAAQIYFSAFDSMILRQKEDFTFLNRERRPPLDPVNAALSYLYVVLNYDCAGALEAVGLDPYVGLFHTDRPGRTSLALDLSEEFRAVMVDRLVLTAINTKQLNIKHFEKKENGAVLLSEEGKSTIINIWQNRKKEIVTHPFLGEKIEMGLLPYAQALLLARTIRGDLEKYPPFLYRV